MGREEEEEEEESWIRHIARCKIVAVMGDRSGRVARASALHSRNGARFAVTQKRGRTGDCYQEFYRVVGRPVSVPSVAKGGLSIIPDL